MKRTTKKRGGRKAEDAGKALGGMSGKAAKAAQRTRKRKDKTLSQIMSEIKRGR